MLTLSELFLPAVDRHDKPDAFLTKKDGKYQAVSSREALRRVATLAVALDAWGVRRGDRIAILSENRLEWTLADQSLLGLGAAVVPIYPTLGEPEIEYILRDSGARGVVLSGGVQLQKLLAIRDKLPEVTFILAMEKTIVGDPAIHTWPAAAESSNAEAVAWFRARAREIQPEDIASILYTSGTTGEPKGVILSHSNFTSNVQACEKLFPLGKNDRALSFLPLSHVFERMVEYWIFWQGVTIAYTESLGALAENFREVQPSFMAVVPRLLENIHDRILEGVRKSSSIRQKLFRWALQVGRQYFPYHLQGNRPPVGLRLKHAFTDRLIGAKIRAALGGRIRYLVSGAAPLAPELAEFFHAMGMPVYEGYGLTETSPVIAVNYPGHTKLGTVGPIIPGVKVRIENEGLEGQEKIGEILISGPSVTCGYYGRNQADRDALLDGWFHTGDLGALDADGYLRITGRQKSLFKIASGKYVAPEKIESLFQGHPSIQQIVALGSGRRAVGALIVPHFGRLEEHARRERIDSGSMAELLSHPQIRALFQKQIDEVTSLLAPHERIHYFTLLPQEFTTASGELSVSLKIKRRVVENRYREVIEKMFGEKPRGGTGL